MNKFVHGKGNKNARIMIIGEAPGTNEVEKEEPFVGKSGKTLDKWLQKLGLKREDLYITNVFKEKTPGNRKPTKDELKAHNAFLMAELFAVKPKIIFCLGVTATETLFQKQISLGQAIGMINTLEFYGNETYVIPLYHPSYASRFKKLDEVDEILERLVEGNIIERLLKA